MNDELLFSVIEKVKKLFTTLYGDSEYVVSQITATSEGDQIVVQTDGDREKQIVFSINGDLIHLGDIPDE